MNLDSRLQAIANFVPIGSRVADIGTDHGYLAIELVKKNIATFVIASDKNIGPLEAARKNIQNTDVENRIDLRLGDGLKTLATGEVDVVCIAGMGGTLICDILNESLEIIAKVDKIILQPMNAADKVRQWASENNFYIEDEDLAEVDDIIYEIFSLNRHQNNVILTKKLKSPLFKKFIETKIKKLQNILAAMSQSPKAKISDKYFEIENQIKELKAKLNENSNSTDRL